MTPSVLRSRDGDGRADSNSASSRQVQKAFDFHCACPRLSLSKLWRQRKVEMFILCRVWLLTLCENRWRERHYLCWGTWSEFQKGMRDTYQECCRCLLLVTIVYQCEYHFQGCFCSIGIMEYSKSLWPFSGQALEYHEIGINYSNWQTPFCTAVDQVTHSKIRLDNLLIHFSIFFLFFFVIYTFKK